MVIKTVFGGISRKSKRRRRPPVRFRYSGRDESIRGHSPQDSVFESGDLNVGNDDVDHQDVHGREKRAELYSSEDMVTSDDRTSDDRENEQGEFEDASVLQTSCQFVGNSATEEVNEHLSTMPIGDQTHLDDDPPELLYINRGKAKGSIRRVADTRAQVVVRYFVTTSISCSCEDGSCNALINVGRWGKMGGGSRVCVHCKLLRKGDWLGAGFGFMGKEDLVRHLKSSQCQTARGLSVSRISIKQELGEHLVYTINNPSNKEQKKVASGEMKDFFTCPKCRKECLWRSRFAHCLLCYGSQGNVDTQNRPVGTDDYQS